MSRVLWGTALLAGLGTEVAPLRGGVRKPDSSSQATYLRLGSP